jgi:hypothetical protein
LKIIEQDILYENETIEETDEKGVVFNVERPKAISSRFIMKCFSVLNTQAAKNWNKFDNFLELLHSFALGEKEPSGKAED